MCMGHFWKKILVMLGIGTVCFQLQTQSWTNLHYWPPRNRVQHMATFWFDDWGKWKTHIFKMHENIYLIMHPFIRRKCNCQITRKHWFQYSGYSHRIRMQYRIKVNCTSLGYEHSQQNIAGQHLNPELNLWIITNL
jgi:hypothetical protein